MMGLSGDMFFWYICTDDGLGFVLFFLGVALRLRLFATQSKVVVSVF